MEEMEITKDLTISQVLAMKPKAIEVFLKHGMPCIGCPLVMNETLEQAAGVHGIDVEELLNELKEVSK